MTEPASVLVATTLRAYKSTGPGETSPQILSWLTWAERWHAAGVRFFLACQRDQVHNADMDTVSELVRSVDGVVWDFSITEPDQERVDNSGRLTGITFGRNLAHEFAQRDRSVSHVLFVDSDVAPPSDCVERLLEVADRYPEQGLIGGDIPTYGLAGPAVDDAPPHWGLQRHWCSAGLLMVSREAFRRLRWRWDWEGGCTDDPSFAADAEAFGFGETVCRHSVVGRHYPETICGFEDRGHNLGLGEDL